ncbi:SRPBCC family protein [Deinococcus psychrotolerans]|uniref:SRPBCC family protein n=2 Tax=Deinococcus TaxID=1298 RepID=A0A553V634_9DEIO|nr:MULTISPECIES: SRPBCC family protein [Deinococcus]AZI42832.1 SRPBCC family protein [Deinococcus psychrotolerans]TSA87940.1 SRPBCC family protein [Deinococcus detaillensis]
MAQPLSFKDTIVIRSRPDVLFRLVLDPKRRTRWDPNIRLANYVGEEKLASGTLVNIKLERRLLGLSYTAKYGQIQAPFRGGWEAVKPFGPIEKYTQSWVFKNIPGGTEVTLSTNATIRYNFIGKQIEAQLRNMSGQTLIELQRAVDQQGAQLMEDTAKQFQDKMRAEKAAAKKQGKTKKPKAAK